jgi:hypothetical protein
MELKGGLSKSLESLQKSAKKHYNICCAASLWYMYVD